MNAMANARDAAEPLEIEVQQVADLGPLVALHRRGGLEQRHAIQAGAGQHARHGRPRQPQRGANLPGRRPRPAQREDRGLERRGSRRGCRCGRDDPSTRPSRDATAPSISPPSAH